MQHLSAFLEHSLIAWHYLYVQGVLPNGNVVAVKQLFAKTSQTGLDEFSNEVVLITGMKHRNLVNLKGCCVREGSRILVYEYVDNYDFDQILLGKMNLHTCSSGNSLLHTVFFYFR